MFSVILQEEEKNSDGLVVVPLEKVNIQFAHFTTKEHNSKKKRFHTTCTLVLVHGETPENPENYEYFGEEAIHNPCDKLNKNMGKKVALEKILKYYAGQTFFTREERAKIWEEFFVRFPLEKLPKNNLTFVAA